MLFAEQSGAWCVDVLEESYALVVNMLQPECACEVYSNLRELLAQSEAAEGDEDHKPCGSEVNINFGSFL